MSRGIFFVLRLQLARFVAIQRDRLPNPSLRGFVSERFRGTRPIAWGDQLTELWLTAGIFRGTLAVGDLADAPEGAPLHAQR